MRGVIHHIDLTVRGPRASFTLYTALPTKPGYHLEREDERGFDWHLDTEHGSHSIGVMEAGVAGARHAHDRHSPALHHLAWPVESRDEVNRMHECLAQIGGTILDPPAEYPQYNKGRGYYAVFFADPDGLKLECVYTPISRAHS